METHTRLINSPGQTVFTAVAGNEFNPWNVDMIPSLPTSRIVNTYEETKALTGITHVDISQAFELSSVSAVYTVLAPKTERKCHVQENVHHFVFIAHGNGGLYTEKDGKPLVQWDCFAFPPRKKPRTYTLVGGKEGVGVIIISDHAKAGAKLDKEPPEFPTIVSSYESTKWSGKGNRTTKKAVLTALTDLSCVPDASRPWNVTMECLVPGTQTSYPHAHFAEDEFCFMLAGKARYWHNGEEPEESLIAGDCVGWKAGTGIAHAILNDADGSSGEGAMAVILTWGDRKEKEDKLWYPTLQHEKKYSDPDTKWVWTDVPKLPVGGASDSARNPRPQEAPYPVWETTDPPEMKDE